MKKIPKPFCVDRSNIRAFVIGCDPTAFDKDNNSLEFEYVFDINGDERYFSGILKNLSLIGLDREDIYVQNLITQYQSVETAGNKQWREQALPYVAERKQEFDELDPSIQIPVLLTSEVLYKVLLNNNEIRIPASELYGNPDLIPITSDCNILKRPLIPLYRHFKYNLSNWPEYKEKVKFCVSAL